MGNICSTTPPIGVPILDKIHHVHSKTDGIAIIESGPQVDKPLSVSYAELISNAQAVAKVLQGLLKGQEPTNGDPPPKHIAYLVNPGIAYVVVELAVWTAGACAVPLSVHSPHPELKYSLEDSDALIVIADKAMDTKLKPVADELKRTYAIIEKPDEATKSWVLTPAPGSTIKEGGKADIKMEDNALMLYTSGTTGKPKGVVHTFLSLTSTYQSLSEAWKWSNKDHTLHVLPLHHIHGVQNILNTALYNGATVEFTPFDAAFCLKRMASGDITCFHAVPTVYTKYTQYLDTLTKEERDPIENGMRNGNMRYMVSGSAALPVPTMSSWAKISGHVLLERYGMTEIGMSLSNRIDDTRYPGCVGWPLPKVEVRLDSENGILVKGGCLFKEYYKKPEVTKKEFTDDGWFKTGDAGQCGVTGEELQKLVTSVKEVEEATGRALRKIGENGPEELQAIYKIMGRSSVDIIKSGGYKISGLEIESVLLQHPKIKECAVIGKPDETWGEAVTAVCALKEACDPKDFAVKERELQKELKEFCKDKMSGYKIPKNVEVVESLPRNAMQKIEKTKLLAKYKK